MPVDEFGNWYVSEEEREENFNTKGKNEDDWKKVTAAERAILDDMY